MYLTCACNLNVNQLHTKLNYYSSYSCGVLSLCYSPHTHRSKLDHHRQRVEPIRRLVKRGYKLNELDIFRSESSDSIVVHCLEPSCVCCQHFLCSLFHIPILIHRWQLPVNFATTTKNHLPNIPSKARTFLILPTRFARIGLEPERICIVSCLVYRESYEL